MKTFSFCHYCHTEQPRRIKGKLNMRIILGGRHHACKTCLDQKLSKAGHAASEGWNLDRLRNIAIEYNVKDSIKDIDCLIQLYNSLGFKSHGHDRYMQDVALQLFAYIQYNYRVKNMTPMSWAIPWDLLKFFNAERV